MDRIVVAIWKKHKLIGAWSFFLVASIAVSTYAATALFGEQFDKSLFLPGPSSAGHYQIEQRCELCHQAFGGIKQQGCVDCHGQELKEASDSHGLKKFRDPRNADSLQKIDALNCVTCHGEHDPGRTRKMGVTLAADFCVYCHRDVAKDRPTHRGLAFDTCAAGGCHKYHDNRALHEDFLLKHAHEPARLPRAELPARNFREVIGEISGYPRERYPLKALAQADADAKPPLKAGQAAMSDWLATSHAKAGVNCSACHLQKGAAGRTAWVEHPSHAVCGTCHDAEVQGFLGGRHGMRLAQKLEPMRPAMARLPMRDKAHDKTLGCTTCHGAHRFDTRRAAVESCLGCHDDRHSRAYKKSAHYALWQKELNGELPPGSGVSCATCHLPRIEYRTADDVKRILVQHNQNDTLRPNEKMIRPVCMNCHGLEFSINALADPGLIARNFQGRPGARVGSMEMAGQADARAQAQLQAKQGSTEVR
jgi:hypothetical protein